MEVESSAARLVPSNLFVKQVMTGGQRPRIDAKVGTHRQPS